MNHDALVVLVLNLRRDLSVDDFLEDSHGPRYHQAFMDGEQNNPMVARPTLDAWGQPHLEDLPDVDIWAQREFRKLSVLERLRWNEQAIRSLEVFREAGRKLNEARVASARTGSTPG